MPPPPLKLYKASFEKETQIEQLLLELGFIETLECFRNERNKRSRVPTDVGDNGNFIEKKGDGWACTFCDKIFTTKGSVKRHLLSTHSADSKQFECPRCTSKFARRDDLYTHLRRMHAANQLVELMIEEHKAELKGEHKGGGKGKLMSVVSHNEHLDVLLPSGATICRPIAVDVSVGDSKEPMKAAKLCRSAKCNHWRIMHDGHEDVLVNGALHHKNEEGEWEFHGEVGSLEDFEFLLSSAHTVGASVAEQNGKRPHDDIAVDSLSHAGPQFVRSESHLSDLKHEEHLPHLHVDHEHLDFNLHEFDFYFGGLDQHHVPQKQTIESLLLPGGSVFCRKVASATPGTKSYQLLQWSSNNAGHTHGLNCGHPRVRHGNHYDYLVDNVIESESEECIMHGSVILEQNDNATLSYVVSALTTDQQESLESEKVAAIAGV